MVSGQKVLIVTRRTSYQAICHQSGHISALASNVTGFFQFDSGMIVIYGLETLGRILAQIRHWDSYTP